MKNRPLNEVWLKASLVGAIWAASEIILGSFLHNLHVPFKGNILTAIGLILMVSVAKVWKDRGLFWRSGLICALMKTLSPSAVIFGPMVAIFMEAVLLEIAVRILGRNLAGILIGSALAMSWGFFQKVFNYILFYGFDIVDLYGYLVQFARKQMNLQVELWTPLVILLGSYVVFGIGAGLAGIRISHSVSDSFGLRNTSILPGVSLDRTNTNGFPYSLAWLVFGLAAFIIDLLLISNTPVTCWAPATILLVGIWVLRYKRAMRQLSKPKFWISFAVITLLMALLISSLGGGGWKDGLMTGIQMNFRAAVVILGFSVFGTELYNPVIRKFLSGTVFNRLPAALELAFDSLPFIVANLPDARTFIRRPAAVVTMLVRHAEQRFKELKGRLQARVFFVTGGIAGGKSTFLASLAESMQKGPIPLGGFYAPRILTDGTTTGYILVSVVDGKQVDFLHLKENDDAPGIGKYGINGEALALGQQWLSAPATAGARVILIDEVGRLELDGKGWNQPLQKLLLRPDLCLVLAVRTGLMESVIRHFGILTPVVFTASPTTLHEAEHAILEALNR